MLPLRPSKKRKLRHTGPTEILFDPAAREDYLTGFHKRKLARVKAAQEIAKRKEREERLRERKAVSLCSGDLCPSGMDVHGAARAGRRVRGPNG